MGAFSSCPARRGPLFSSAAFNTHGRWIHSSGLPPCCHHLIAVQGDARVLVFLDEHVAIPITHSEHRVVVCGVAGDLPRLFEFKEQILRLYVTSRRAVEHEPATAPTEFAVNDIVSQVKCFDALQLIDLDGSSLEARIPATARQDRHDQICTLALNLHRAISDDEARLVQQFLRCRAARALVNGLELE